MNYDPVRRESGQHVEVCNACKTGAFGTGAVSKFERGGDPYGIIELVSSVLSTFPVQHTCP